MECSKILSQAMGFYRAIVAKGSGKLRVVLGWMQSF